MSMKTMSLVSLPVSLGQPFLGPDRSPSQLRENGLLQMLGSCGWRINQVPELVTNFMLNTSNDALEEEGLRANNCAQVGAVCEKIYQQGLQYANSNDFLLILGGDHCIPIGTIPAIVKHRPGTGVIWVDAHADINTPTTSLSGNMHGMPVAFLTGLVKEATKLPSFSWFTGAPYINPADIVYVGLRDLDSAEKRSIKKLGIKAFTMYDVDKHGIGWVMDQALAHLQNHTNLHMSFDIDALDPFFAPHTGTAVRGGLTFREGNYICEAAALTGKLTSMELVEVNPSLHPDLDSKQTIEMSLTLIGSAMGRSIL